MAQTRALDLRSDPTDLRIEVGDVADAGALAELGARTFYDSYAFDYPADDMATYMATWFTPQGLTEEILDPGSVFLLAYRDGDDRPLAYGKLRSSAPPACAAPGAIELQRLYVERSHMGTGIGAGLLRRCFEHARVVGRDHIWCGVDRGNARAIGFYESWDFHIVGEHLFTLGRVVCSDLVMQAPCR